MVRTRSQQTVSENPTQNQEKKTTKTKKTVKKVQPEASTTILERVDVAIEDAKSKPTPKKKVLRSQNKNGESSKSTAKSDLVENAALKRRAPKRTNKAEVKVVAGAKKETENGDQKKPSTKTFDTISETVEDKENLEAKIEKPAETSHPLPFETKLSPGKSVDSKGKRKSPIKKKDVQLSKTKAVESPAKNKKPVKAQKKTVKKDDKTKTIETEKTHQEPSEQSEDVNDEEETNKDNHETNEKPKIATRKRGRVKTEKSPEKPVEPKKNNKTRALSKLKLMIDFKFPKRTSRRTKAAKRKSEVLPSTSSGSKIVESNELLSENSKKSSQPSSSKVGTSSNASETIEKPDNENVDPYNFNSSQTENKSVKKPVKSKKRVSPKPGGNMELLMQKQALDILSTCGVQYDSLRAKIEQQIKMPSAPEVSSTSSADSKMKPQKTFQERNLQLENPFHSKVWNSPRASISPPFSEESFGPKFVSGSPPIQSSFAIAMAEKAKRTSSGLILKIPARASYVLESEEKNEDSQVLGDSNAENIIPDGMKSPKKKEINKNRSPLKALAISKLDVTEVTESITEIDELTLKDKEEKEEFNQPTTSKKSKVLSSSTPIGLKKTNTRTSFGHLSGIEENAEEEEVKVAKLKKVQVEQKSVPSRRLRRAAKRLNRIEEN
ncbi:CLUMA_CG002521, isoform A [Clunio marinus]|uniref:CLUMA_CG002521, isoform A n=1 Tax=Clunio marinus TaxID=568069 RepID=A0A1J1HL26_9DIPT|nr:CLUMA_CG002521, isoform A [Clunio marinus]